MSAKFDNDIIIFFEDIPDQIFLLFQNLLVYIHSHFSAHCIWTSPWLDWKKIFVQLHTETFVGAKFDDDTKTSLVDNQIRISFFFGTN